MALRARWRAAFDAADAALRAAARQLPPKKLHEHALRLAAEREPTAQLLRDFARDQAAVAGSFEHLARNIVAGEPRKRSHERSHLGTHVEVAFVVVRDRIPPPASDHALLVRQGCCRETQGQLNLTSTVP
jgi:hypothetical protein